MGRQPGRRYIFQEQALAQGSTYQSNYVCVSAGDVTKGTPPTIGGAGTPGTYPYPNDYMRDHHFLAYLSLIENHPLPIFEVPGNHDLSRGGWLTRPDDTRYDAGQALWRKYLGPINYSFDVADTHFTFCNSIMICLPGPKDGEGMLMAATSD